MHRRLTSAKQLRGGILLALGVLAVLLVAGPALAEEPESVLTTIVENVEDRRSEIEGLIATHQDNIVTSRTAITELNEILADVTSKAYAAENCWLKIQDLPSSPILRSFDEYDVESASLPDATQERVLLADSEPVAGDLTNWIGPGMVSAAFIGAVGGFGARRKKRSG